MTPTDDIERRWKELAEQLGLPPESAAQDSAVPQAPGKSDIEPESPAVSRFVSGTVAEPPASQQDAEEMIGIPTKHQELKSIPETRSAQEERQPSRERRRGGRGGRRAEPRSRDGVELKRSEDEGVASADITSAEETSEPTSSRERSRRRGRGRGRRAKATHDDSGAPAAADEQREPQAEEESSVSAPEDYAEDDNDMSGWSIPSWQELIDSLYRPER